MSSPRARSRAVSRYGRLLRLEYLEDRRLLSVAPSHGAYLMTAGNAGPAQAVPSAASAAVAPLDQGFYTTTTTLTSSATQGSVGEMITLTATVKVQIGTPTGTVQFSIDNKPYGSPVSLSYPNAQASISLNTLTAGVHVVTAAYVSAIPVLYDDSAAPPWTSLSWRQPRSERTWRPIPSCQAS